MGHCDPCCLSLRSLGWACPAQTQPAQCISCQRGILFSAKHSCAILCILSESGRYSRHANQSFQSCCIPRTARYFSMFGCCLLNTLRALLYCNLPCCRCLSSCCCCTLACPLLSLCWYFLISRSAGHASQAFSAQQGLHCHALKTATYQLLTGSDVCQHHAGKMQRLRSVRLLCRAAMRSVKIALTGMDCQFVALANSLLLVNVVC